MCRAMRIKKSKVVERKIRTMKVIPIDNRTNFSPFTLVQTAALYFVSRSIGYMVWSLYNHFMKFRSCSFHFNVSLNFPSNRHFSFLFSSSMYIIFSTDFIITDQEKFIDIVLLKAYGVFTFIYTCSDLYPSHQDVNIIFLHY